MKRLALDIGSTSIGWWLYEVEGFGQSAQATNTIDQGVRIFSNGRNPKNTSLAVDRREARSARKTLRRYKQRRKNLMNIMVKSGLMPQNSKEAKLLEGIDPFMLRTNGLDEQLPLHHLGRSLFHINQRRGFKSNRKIDGGDQEAGKIKMGVARLDEAMQEVGARTLGEFLHMRQQQAVDSRNITTVRNRLTADGYDYYPDRRHLETEFDTLWNAQKEYYSTVLTDDLHDKIFDIIFYQRPLKAPIVGKCLLTGDVRLPKAHPLTQRRVLFEMVNHLRILSDGNPQRPLTLEERDMVIDALDNKNATKHQSGMKLSFHYIAKTVLGLSNDESFTHDTEERDSIVCDPIRTLMGNSKLFGAVWNDFGWETQWSIVSLVREIQNDSDFVNAVGVLMSDYDLDHDTASAVANTTLPEGYGRLGFEATSQVLAKLVDDVVSYAEAVALCGWHHSDHRTGEILDTLPYYGKVLDRHVVGGTADVDDDDIMRYGRISNPTVHIGLGQIQKLMNQIIKVYGKPEQIVVEVARDWSNSSVLKAQMNKTIYANTNANIRRGRELEVMGVRNTYSNRKLLRLYEDLGEDKNQRRCPYTGTIITPEMVFDGSCDDDHILPFSRTLDDGFSNHTLCLREANRHKGAMTPWEAWGGTNTWDTIKDNIKNIPKNKQWRFSPDAMEQFEGENDFLDRALSDTQYLSKIARTYLDTLYTSGGHVWTVTGRMTSILRNAWRMNSLLNCEERKNRNDHRHHAVDAAVIGIVTPQLIKSITKAVWQYEQVGQDAKHVATGVPVPWDGFQSDIKKHIDDIVVSYRANHNTNGALHDSTACSIVDEKTVASYKPIVSLTINNIGNIKDQNIRDELTSMVAGKKHGSVEYNNALRAFSELRNVRRVKVTQAVQESARISMGADDDGKPTKAYRSNSNHCYEIWRLPDGVFVPVVPQTFDANTGVDTRPHPAAKLIQRFYKRDMIAMDINGETEICYIQKFGMTGLFMAPHVESNSDKRSRDKNDPFKFIAKSTPKAIMDANVRRVSVDVMGNIRGL
jgi:CRISPR-associated endonuclease Csn1